MMDTFAENARPFEIEWPEPDMSLLHSRRSTPPEFPIELFGDRWAAWMTATAENTSAPVDYVAAGMLACATALIGGARRSAPWEGWKEPTILNFGVLGDPSASKTPALRPSMALVRETEKLMNEDYADRLREYETQLAFASACEDQWKASVKDAAEKGTPPPDKPEGAVRPEAPALRRVLVGDTTPEALTTVLANNPKGVLLFNDELTGFFKNLTRYSGDARALYVSAFNGDAMQADREKYGGTPRVVPFFGVSILGGIQPDRLSEMMKGDADDGLLARFILLWPNSVPRARPTARVDHAFAESAFNRLSSINCPTDQEGGHSPTVLPFDDDAAALFEQWWKLSGSSKETLSGLVKSFYGKLPGMCIRLACVFEHLEWSAGQGPEPTGISLLSVRRACQFVDGYVWPMAKRVYSDVIRTRVDHQATALCQKIVAERMTVINGKAVYRDYHIPNVNNAGEAAPVIGLLLERDWLFAADNDGARGRPSKDYAVNPKVFTGGVS